MNLKTVVARQEKLEPELNPNITVSASTDRKLVYSILTNDEWEILIYKRRDIYEACFFRWAIHHEHATAFSFEAVHRQVEQRIRTLKSRRLRKAIWRNVVH